MRTDYDVAILGAGVVGVTTAWWAARAGLSAVVIERQPAAALETSFANGGQISVSHAEPWAHPRIWGMIPKALFDTAAPIHVRLRADPHQWRWLARFLGDCTRVRHRASTLRLLDLGLRSRAALKEILEAEAIDYHRRQTGILYLHDTPQALAIERRRIAFMNDHGANMRLLCPEEALALEPALESTTLPIAGATFSGDDESGDAHRFTQELADRCARRGVHFRYGETVDGLTRDTDGGACGVRLTSGELLRARHVVVALGWSAAPFLRRHGVDLPILPAKGYSMTVPIAGFNGAPNASITDIGQRLVFTRLGDELRVAGFLELGAVPHNLDPQRTEQLARAARRRLPLAGDFSRPRFWTGLRPATPDNAPIVGKSRLPGVWLNVGHGTLGWTMAAGSGQQLIAAICKES